MAESSRTRSIPLRETSLLSSNDHQPDPVEHAGTTAPASEKSRTRLFVLAGAAISQLPIWGFAMSYGVFQQYYYDNWTFKGSRETTGIIGTTFNGVIYLSMPFMFALFAKRLARWRRVAALCGAAIACLGFVLSSFSKSVMHLVLTQGVLAALGGTLMYSPTTLSLGEWFNTPNRICNRAVAYGIVLSSKNIVGSTCPFLFRGLLDRYDFQNAVRIWAVIMAATSVLSIFMIPTPSSTLSSTTVRSRQIPLHFLKHQTFYIYSIATLLQSAGYGIPQTYLSEYARNVSLLSQTFSTLLITLINIPGIASSSFFGYLSDNKYFTLSAGTVTSVSAISSALAAFLFWGLATQGSIALLVLFAITFGFFASGYSATWGGVMNAMELEAAQNNEAIDTGVLYGLLNGARGIGYVGGGLASVPLIKAGNRETLGDLGYGTVYGPLIIFTGLSLAFGGWGLAWRWKL